MPDVPQQKGRRLAVVAIAAVAINHDLFRRLANRKERGKISFRTVRIELIGPGNVRLAILQVVTGINEYDIVFQM